MRKLMLFFILATVFFSGCFKELPFEEVTACSSDDECIIVDGVGCCKCPRAINNEYQDYWEKLNESIKEDCSDVACVPCMFTSETACRNGKCSFVYPEEFTDQ